MPFKESETSENDFNFERRYLNSDKPAEAAQTRLQSALLSSLENQRETIVFSIDQNYNYLYFNKAHLDSMKFSYDRDIEIGMNILDYITSDDDRALLNESFSRALKGESFSYIQTYGNVNRAYYECFFNPVLGEKNEIVGGTCLARNVTERVYAEQSLKNSEIKFKEIIDQIKDAIVVFEENERIIIWNKGAEQLCGIKAEDVLNKSISDIQYQLTPPTNRDRTVIGDNIKVITSMKTQDVFNQIIDSEIVPLYSENTINIQSMVFPIKLSENNLFCTVIRDTTEVKRYEKELLRISTEKDKFYSVIAQYLYTPFNVFKNFSKVMAEELDSLPIKEIQKMALMMSNSARNLFSLLDNLLQWTRMNQGKISFEPKILNLKQISQEAISILEPLPDSKNFRINYFINDEITVYADIFMLKTIFRNIVSSIIKFSGGEGQIDIHAEQTSSKVIISVLNDGMKLDYDYLTNLFNNLQIHSAIGGVEEKGTPLGLLLCKEFVEKHSGEIWVVNGNSTGFKFTLSAKAKNVNKIIDRQ
jgi:PAS domain S-box-containing protein